MKDNLESKIVGLHLEEQFGKKEDSSYNHRLKIREHILNHYAKGSDHILDLQLLPKTDQYYFSISHTKGLGGYVVSAEPVGLDIENLSRLNSKLIERISNASERNLLLDPRWLWCIKEASFKVASLNQITEVQLVSIHESHFETNLTLGFVKQVDSYIYAVAFCKS